MHFEPNLRFEAEFWTPSYIALSKTENTHCIGINTIRVIDCLGLWDESLFTTRTYENNTTNSGLDTICKNFYIFAKSSVTFWCRFYASES